MTWAVLLASMLLAAVAATGILRPYRAGGRATLERLNDPLDDERAALLRSLRELEDERRAGTISAPDYAGLRAETEVRAVAVLRALEARDGEAVVADGMREARAGLRVRTLTEPDGGAAPERSRTPLAAAALGAVLTLALVPLLIHAVASRSPGGAISGDSNLSASQSPPADAALASLEQRVRLHPGDVSARLELADRYVRDRRTGLAALQYTQVLALQPHSVEANTRLASIVAAAGRAEDALFLVGRALAVSPNDPQALYEKGLILLNGLHRPGEAASAFRAYLRAAPYGSHRDEVRRLLDGITPGP